MKKEKKKVAVFDEPKKEDKPKKSKKPPTPRRKHEEEEEGEETDEIVSKILKDSSEQVNTKSTHENDSNSVEELHSGTPRTDSGENGHKQLHKEPRQIFHIKGKPEEKKGKESEKRKISIARGLHFAEDSSEEDDTDKMASSREPQDDKGKEELEEHPSESKTARIGRIIDKNTDEGYELVFDILFGIRNTASTDNKKKKIVRM